MLIVFLILALTVKCHSRRINVTIDDTWGDERTGAKPQYDDYSWDEYPEYYELWAYGQALTPDDLDGTYNGTLNCIHSYREPATASLTFHGTAIYFFIARRADATINMTFYRDGLSMPVYQYFVDPDPSYDSDSKWLYNQLAFKDDQLADEEHTLTFVLDGDTSYASCFDYAIYTMDDGIPSANATTDLPGDTGTGGTSPSSAVPAAGHSRADARRGALSAVPLVGGLIMAALCV